MINKNSLKLLVIDGNQLYAEHIVELLSTYYDDVSLGFLDDKQELIKMLRRPWDVLVYGRAYDMKLTDVVAIIEERSIDLPVIGLMSDEIAASGCNSTGMPKVIDTTLIKAINPEQETHLVMGIMLQHQALKTRRELTKLQSILRESEQRANILIKNSKSAVAYIEEGIHIFANEPYLKLFGYDSMEELMGVPVIDLIAGGDDIKEFKQFLRRFTKGSRDDVEFKFKSKRTDKTTFEAKLQLAAATYEGMPVTQIIIQQNDSGANAAEIARKLAAVERMDSLTGLENRRGFMERLVSIHESSKASKADAGLMYIRLDHLGKINSSVGIQGVDATVKQVAYLLQEYFADHYVSRFSDGIFTVLVQSTTDEQLQKYAKELLERISDLMIEVGKRTASTTVTIGMVIIDEYSPDADTILDRAVEAYNQVMVKTDHVGNDSHLYDPSQYVNNDDDALAEYLASSLTDNNFGLTFQPIYDIETDSSNKFEVYLNLKLSDGTTKPPNEFIPVAQANNLMTKIDRWLLVNACKQLNQARGQNPQLGIVVRLTAETLTDEQLPKAVGQLIKALGGDSNALTLQFSEQDVMNYLTVAKKQFDILSSLNCQLSIQNFGSTSKSIEIIEYVKPDMVRLARSYVTDLSNPENVDTMKSLIALTTEQKVNVLMPYIEEASTMSVAWSVGARYLQGNYLQTPGLEMVVSEG